jgi:hypothetical protein
MREGEQPLRNKSRGRIIHVSDFILEHCGWLRLNAEEIAFQMTLPRRPLPPTIPSSSTSGLGTGAARCAIPDTSTGRPSKAKKTRKSVGTEGRTFAEQENEWIPPPPPAPFSSYRLSSFAARRIIYPGANYDPWWDMPQLIQQVRFSFLNLIILINYFLDKKRD